MGEINFTKIVQSITKQISKETKNNNPLEGLNSRFEMSEERTTELVG